MSSLIRTIRKVYNPFIRPRLPKKLGYVNGVVTRRPALLDIQDTLPDYERPIIDAVRHHTREDDDVVIVGGGYGVSAIHAGRLGNSVEVFEASETQCDIIREALEINATDNVTVTNALVGPGIHVYNGDTAQSTVDPAELPACDVLELDCEGAELTILRQLDSKPRVIIVETHPKFGVATEDVEAILEESGYDIVNRDFEDEDAKLEVLTAVRR